MLNHHPTANQDHHEYKLELHSPRPRISPFQCLEQEFLQAFPHLPITIVGIKTKVIRPVKRTVLQRVGDILCDSEREVFNVRINKPGVFEPANIELELGNHRLEASNCQLHIRVLGVDSIVAGTVIADKEIGN